jgi:RND family efflux transporter MFP subunit
MKTLQQPAPVIKYIFIITVLAFLVPAPSPAGEGRDIFVVNPAPRTVRLYGFTKARAFMTVVSEVSGKCLEIRADVGDKIAADGLFAQIDPTFIKLELEQNRISREQTKSRIAYLKKELKRFELLFSRHSTAESQLDKLTQELDQARYNLKLSENQQKVLAERLERHLIHTPPGWQVIKRLVEPGEWLNIGQPLAELGDFQTLVVPFALSPAEYTALGRLHSISLLPVEKQQVKAEIYRVSPDFDPQSRKINLQLILIDKLPDNRGGIRLELKLDIPEKGVFTVPASAVIRRYGENLLQKESGEMIPVVIHSSSEQKLRVASPLIQPGDHFFLNPSP